MSGRVDGFDEGDEPLVHGTTFDGNKGNAGAETDGDGGQRIFEKEGQGKLIDEETQDDASGEPDELLEGHVADEAELVAGDVLGDGMLFDGHRQ